MGRRSRSSRKSRRRRNASPAPRIFFCVLLLAAAAFGGWKLWGQGDAGESILGDNSPGLAGLTGNAAGAEEYTGLTEEEADAVLAEVESILAQRDGVNDQQKLAEAHALMQQVLDPATFSMKTSIRKRLLPTFHKLTDTLFVKPGWSPFRTTYVVQDLDSLGKIAEKFNVTEAILCKWNGIPEDKKNIIHVGRTLTITTGQPRISVDKSDFCLSYFMGDRLVRQYIIAHGKAGITPLGTSVVVTKQENPDHGTTNPMRLEMDARWMGLKDFGGRTGIGIHGTHAPESIGKAESHGCVRMYSHEVEELFDLVPFGTPVTITA